MTIEPTRLIHEDPGFAHLVAASEEDGPSPVQVDDAVSLARRMASASRPRLWRLLGAGTAVVGASMFGLVAASSVSSGSGAATSAAEMAPPVALAAGPIVAPTAEPSNAVEDVAPSAEAPPLLAVAPASTIRTVAPRGRPATAKPGGDRHEENARGPSAGEERSTFDEELGLLSAARAGLAARDTPASLRAVERYQSRFPSGLFAEEIEVIRIEALADSGDRARAHALAERFLAVNPSSAYAVRVRSLAQRTRD